MYNLNNYLSEHGFPIVRNGYSVEQSTHVFNKSISLVNNYQRLESNLIDIDNKTLINDLKNAIIEQIDTWINS